MHRKHRERLRKKFLTAPDSMERHEILELLLTFSIPRKNTNDLAHDLINKFGSFSAIFDAPIKSLKSVKGIGNISAILIKTVSILIRFYTEDKVAPANKILTKDQIGQIFMSKFIGRSEESVALVLLGPKMRMLFCDILVNGTLSCVDACVKNIIGLSLEHHAKYAIIAHNHPSGVPLPSKSDIDATIYLKEALKHVEVKLLDHFILSDSECVSLADSDLNEIF